MSVKQGDWIRFYQAGRLVIGKVEYIDETGSYGPEAMTDIGSVKVTAIIESRPPQGDVKEPG